MTGLLLASRRCFANDLGMWPIPEGTLRGTGDTGGWPVVKRGERTGSYCPSSDLAQIPFGTILWRDAVYAHMRVGIVLPLLSLWTWFSCSPSFASPFQASPAASPQDKNTSQQARETLQASALAYQQVVALSDVLTYTVTTPNAVLPPKPLKMTLGSGTQVALEDPLIVAVALDGSLFVTKSDSPGKYVARPYSGDFAKALDAVVGEQGWPMEPLQIAMRLGKGIDGWLTALRFKQLAPLQISGYEKKTDQGRWFDEIHFRAENGWLDADF